MSERRPAVSTKGDIDLPSAWVGHLSRYGQESGVWLALGEAKRSMPPVQWERMVQLLAVQEMPKGKPSLFLAVFMFVHTRDVRWLRTAGDAARQCGEIERLHAFMVFVWGTATALSENRKGFRRLFELAGLPGSLMHASGSLADSLASPGTAPRVLPGRPASSEEKPVRRVAILSQQLSIFTHAGTQLALEHAALLKGAGIEVRVFSAQEMQDVDIQGWLGSSARLALSPATPAGWKPVTGPRSFQVMMAREPWPQHGRWQITAANLAKFAPDVVLFVGFFSPLLSWVWKYYPVVGLSVHTLPPLGFVDVWLHQFETGETLPTPWACLPRPVPFPYSFRLALPPARSVSLAPLKLPPGALIMVTAGYRLQKEIRQNWVTEVLARLEAHARWVWLVVGNKKAPPSLPLDHPRIRVLPHQDNFDGLLKQCNLYLNPQRMGGGFSIMNAMARSVPVVSLGGSDGGDKLGPWSVASMQDYWRRVDELMGDEAARASCGQALSQRFESMYNLHAATPSLLAALDEGRKRFQQRAGAEA